ncbi:MAG: ATP-binding cassette domain-containing protein [Planctomycetota bacterium]
MESDTPNATSTAGPKTEEPIIRLRGLHKRFGPMAVLNGLDLDFRPGETTVILGPSGTGKSVTLKHIVGLLQPDAGEVYFHEHRVDRLKERDLVDLRKRIGFLFQMGAMFDSMTVGQNVEFPLVEHTNMTRRQRAEKVDRLLKMVGLGKTQDKMPADLSGGQRKRAALARAIALEPEVMLYDEPTTGLDPIRSDVINELILALTKQLGMTSIVVTHDMNSANKVADRMVLLYEGQVAADSDPCTFRNSQSELVQRFIRGQADQQDIELIRMGFKDGISPNLEPSRGDDLKNDEPAASPENGTAAAMQTKEETTPKSPLAEDRSAPSVFLDE